MTVFVTAWTPFFEINAWCWGVRIFLEGLGQSESTHGSSVNYHADFSHRSKAVEGNPCADPDMRWVIYQYLIVACP